MTEMMKYGIKSFKCANVQIGGSSGGPVAISRAPRGPVT